VWSGHSRPLPLLLTLLCHVARVPHPNAALFATLGWDSTTAEFLGFCQRPTIKDYQPEITKAAVARGFLPNSTPKTLLLLRLRHSLIPLDTPADPILLPINPALFSPGQMPIVRSHVRFLAVLHGRLALFQMRGLLRGQRPFGNAIPDALLLIRFTSVDLVHSRMSRIMNARSRAGSVVGCGLRGSGTDKHQSPHRKNCEHVADFAGHAGRKPPAKRVVLPANSGEVTKVSVQKSLRSCSVDALARGL